MNIDRRQFLFAAGVAVVGTSTTTGTAAAEPSASLWQEFVANPYDHPQIPNVAYAGHRTGERPPRRPVLADVLFFGARRDGSADAAPAINRAIEFVGRLGGGTVLVPPGRYRIDDIIRIGYDNVVLRGAGSTKTTFYATRSLEQIIGINRSRYGSENSAWSWSGGLVWVCHRDRYQPLVDAIKARRWPFEGWTGNELELGSVLTEVTGSAARGAFVVTVANGHRLRAGQRVLLRLDDSEYSLPRHMCGDIPGTASYRWDDKTKLLSYFPFLWPVRVEWVRGNRVKLAQPLPLEIRQEWKPRLTTMAPVVTGAGVEGIKIEMFKVPTPKHLQDKGYNGVAFQCAWDCWADDVHVHDVDNGFLLVSAKGISLLNTRVSGRGHHHAYATREQSHDNLTDGFVIEAPSEPSQAGAGNHGLNVEGLSCGNVWTRGRMDHDVFDTHRGLPFGNVRTEITINNVGAHGGSADAGPLYGARFAHWNVTVTNQRAGNVRIDQVAPCSATVAISEVRDFGQVDKPDFTGPLHSRLELYGTTDVVPRNLYDAQKRLRRR